MQNSANTRPPSTRKLFDTMKSSSDWISPIPGICTPDHTEKPRTHGMESNAKSGPLMAMARLRVMFHSSIEKRRMFSNTAITVESAAKAMQRKNTVPHNCPNGICSNTAGRVRNTRLGPESGATPYAKHAGKMMRPAMMATSVSMPAICTASPVSLRSRPM